jgi:hypothetical protein
VLPFTTEQFFDVFRHYNEGVWPTQFVLYLLGFVGVGARLAPEPVASAATRGVLAALWLWMGVVYHIAYFTSINPAAYVFGGLSVLGAVVFAWRALGSRVAQGDRIGRVGLVAGAALLAYGLVVYPLVGLAVGHRYPAAPGFGLPCPTTIYTIGLLTLVPARGRWAELAVPVAWAAVGSTAAFALGVPEDYGLAVAGLWGVWLLTGGRARGPAN